MPLKGLQPGCAISSHNIHHHGISVLLHELVWHISFYSPRSFTMLFDPFSDSVQHLPLGLLPRQELIQNRNILLQSLEPLLQLGLHLGVVVSQLLVKVLPVRRRAHGSVEDWLDKEPVVGLEGVAVCLAERVGEFLGRVGDVVAEGLRGEVEATDQSLVSNQSTEIFQNVPVQPNETLGGGVLLLLELVEDEVLECLGKCGGGKLSVADFLPFINCHSFYGRLRDLVP